MEVDRFAKGYQPNFDIDAEVGRQGEIFIGQVIDALKAGASVEVKTDAQFAKTGNVYIEYGCLKRGGWAPSGIATSTAEVWAFQLGEGAGFVVEARRLRAATRELKAKGFIRECLRGTHPTKGVVVPLLTLLATLRGVDEAEMERAA